MTQNSAGNYFLFACIIIKQLNLSTPITKFQGHLSRISIAIAKRLLLLNRRKPAGLTNKRTDETEGLSRVDSLVSILSFAVSDWVCNLNVKTEEPLLLKT